MTFILLFCRYMLMPAGQSRAMHPALCEANEGSLYVGVSYAKRLNVRLELGLVEGLFCSYFGRLYREVNIYANTYKCLMMCDIDSTYTLFVNYSF